MERIESVVASQDELSNEPVTVEEAVEIQHTVDVTLMNLDGQNVVKPRMTLSIPTQWQIMFLVATCPSLSLSDQTEPRTYEEAIKDLRWVEAMKQEITALEDNLSGIVVTSPPKKN